MKRLGLQFVVGLVLTAALFWFLDRNLLAATENGWADVLAAARALPWWAIPAYALAFLGVHVARVVRWVWQVRPLGERDMRLVTSVCAVGYAAIVLFPFRVGELVRPYLLARRSEQVTFSAAMGTAVVERIIDGLFITALFFVTILTAPMASSPLLHAAGYTSATVFVSASVGLALFAWQRAFATRLLGWTFGTVDRALAAMGRSVDLSGKVEGLMEDFLAGLRSLRSDGTLVPFLVLTVVYWGINAFGIWLFARAFGLDVPLVAGVGLLSVLVVGIMVPGGPGLVGTFQIALTEGLKLYLPAASIGPVALSFALLMNLIQLVIQVGFAYPFLRVLGMGAGDVVRAQQASRSSAVVEGQGR